MEYCIYAEQHGKKCMRISVVNSCFVSLISLFLSLIVLLIGKITFWHDTVITLGFWQISACLAALFIHVTISMFIPLLMIGRTQPKRCFKTLNHKVLYIDKI